MTAALRPPPRSRLRRAVRLAWLVMALGLARLADRSRSLTASSVKILGTLRYMPPEQLQRSLR